MHTNTPLIKHQIKTKTKTSRVYVHDELSMHAIRSIGKKEKTTDGEVLNMP